MRRVRKEIYLGACLLLLLLAGCGGFSGTDGGYLISADETYETTGEKPEDYVVEDRKTLYEGEDQEVVTMYLTVGQGNQEDGTDHTWTEVNSYPLEYYETEGIDPYRCEAVLQIGDEEGPIEGEFVYGERAANATVQLRGQGASTQQQKSYRIKIKDGKGDWEGQKTISLNKHVGDPVRFKNKLAYSLMEDIPQMFGARTRFVHLYVKDKTQGEEGLFRDYGIYTQVEQINKTYLRNRGLDEEGQLYQAGRSFDWGRHEDAILPATDPEYDQARFEQYLKIDGSEDHEKLVRLLAAVNDTENDIRDVIEQYFDKENLYYWMAFHILMGNKEALEGNYYLYNPRGLDRWYFISWDNDSILEEGYETLRDASYDRSWKEGIFLFAEPVLFRRILRDTSCREALSAAVEDLRKNYLTDEAVQEKIEVYQETVKAYLYELPDQTFARVTPEEYDSLTSTMAAEIQADYEGFQDSMEGIWPFHILTPSVTGGETVLNWEDAYRFQEGNISYVVELARDPEFAELILREETEENRYSAGVLAPGQYFVRVVSQGPEGISQDAYEYYQTEIGTVSYSTLCFYIQEDGRAVALEYSEDG